MTRPELIFSDLPAADRSEVLRTFAERVAGEGLVRNGAELFQRLWEREQLGSTGIGSGIAIPHCKLAGMTHGIVAVGMVPGGVDFGASDGRPVKVLFLVVSPSGSPAEHLQVLAAISRWLRADHHAERILALQAPAQVYDLLSEET
ncbi:MAG TPA: PTS sugar transporter subunit IIA [Thermoanaerobaculia bacterium]|nr:PTS sugar transporter subunit IIA [Thermoanaerobaculia bacterium]